MLFAPFAYAMDRSISVYVTGDITVESCNRMCDQIEMADSPGMTLYVHINSPGGMVDPAEHVCDLLDHSKAKVVAVIDGEVASMAFSILLHCHYVIVHQFGEMVIHAAYINCGLFDSHIGPGLDKMHHDQEVLYKPYLTDKEMNYVFVDWKDLYWNEATFLSRINKPNVHLKAELESQPVNFTVNIPIGGKKNERNTNHHSN